MKTIDTKSLLLGVLATSLVLFLTSGKVLDNNDNIDFVASPNGVGIFNKETKTIYLYKVNAMSVSLKETPDNIYIVAADGSFLTKK
jgi:hypothetical protein